MSATLAYDTRDELIATLQAEVASFKARQVDYQLTALRLRETLAASEARSRQVRSETDAFDDERYQRAVHEGMKFRQRAVIAELENETLKTQLAIERAGHAAVWAAMPDHEA